MKRNKSHIIDNINKTAGISKSKAKQVLDVIDSFELELDGNTMSF